jgi:hypothetical protein
VANLFNGRVEKGITEKIEWNTGKLPAGVYVSRLQTPSGIIQRKIILNH